jgi:hypothetical protein
MPYHARTYGSALQQAEGNVRWNFPTGPNLDTFGVPIGLQTFGLEEFNFHPFLLNMQLAYIPCYGTHGTYPRNPVNELRLIYRIHNNGEFNYMHYATLYEVRTILNEEILVIRNVLEPDFNAIYLNQNCQDFFGHDFPEYENCIQNMFAANLIADNQNNSSFVVNVRYDALEIQENPVPCILNAHYASNWYQNVIYP